MYVAQYQEVDETLLLLSEARERAERAARTVTDAGGQQHIVEALARVDRQLTALYRQLMDEALFTSADSVKAELQLALDAR